MKIKLIAVIPFVFLAACGGSPETLPSGDGPATLEDLDDVNVYRPRHSGPDRPVPEEESAVTEDVAPQEEKPVRGPEPAAAEEPEPAVEAPRPEPAPEPEPATAPETAEEPDREPEPRGDREALADAFIADVNARLPKLEDSAAWKSYLKASEAFDDEYAAVKKKRGNAAGRDVERAWADTIKAWYEARYHQALFVHLNRGREGFTPVFMHERDKVLALDVEYLQCPRCVSAQAAEELVSAHGTALAQFRTDALKYDRKAAAVHADKEWRKHWKVEQKKWQDAVDGKFDNEDVKKFGE